MYKKEQICNRALIILNIPLISSLDENTKEARECKFLYDIIKKEVLSMYFWKNALRTKKLKYLYNEDTKLNYQYKYLLPNNLIRLIEVNSSNNYYKDNHYIYSNDVGIEIKYIENIDEDDLGLDLARLISFKLALEISYSYSENITFINFLKNMFQEEFQKATNMEAKSGTAVLRENEEISSWLLSRY